MTRRPYYRLRPDQGHGFAVLRFMCAADGYAMVRRPRCIPFVVDINSWNSWAECDRDGNIVEAQP